MVRIQLHLTEEQDRRLRALAERRRTTRAELIRRGIDRVLQDDERGEDALLDLVGAAGSSPRTDLSERHDEVLYDPGHEPPLRIAAEKDPEFG